MKLHLPCTLRQAVLSCLALVSSSLPVSVSSGAVAFGVCSYLLSSQPLAARTAQLTTDRTVRGGTTYSGRIFEYAEPNTNGTVAFVNGTFSYRGDANSGGAAFSIAGTATGTASGAASDGGSFWQNALTNATSVGSDAGSYGHTIYVDRKRDQRQIYTFNWAPLVLGGLISDNSNGVGSTRWTEFRSDTAGRLMEIRAASGLEAIFSIRTNTYFKNWNINAYSNSRWDVHSGKSLGFEDSTISLQANVALAINRVGTGNATVNQPSDFTLFNNASLSVSEGMTLNVQGVLGIHPGARITNNGTINVKEINSSSDNGIGLYGAGRYNFTANAVLHGGYITFVDNTTFAAGSGFNGLSFYGIRIKSSNSSKVLTWEGDMTWNGNGQNDVYFEGIGSAIASYVSNGTITLGSQFRLDLNNATWTTHGLVLEDGAFIRGEGGTHNILVSDNSTLTINGGTTGSTINNVSLTLQGSVTMNGNGELVGTGAIAADGANAPTVTVESGSEITISTTGNKNFGNGVSLMSGSVLRVKNLTGWQGSVSGPGTLALDLGGFDQNVSTNYIFHGLSGTAANGSFAPFFGTGAPAVVCLENATFMQVAGSGNDWSTQNSNFSKFTRLEVTDGSSFAIRPLANADVGLAESAGQRTISISGDGQYMQGSRGEYRGALMVLVDCAGNNAISANLNFDVELATSATMFVGDETGTAARTAVLGAVDGSGLFTGDGHTLTKDGLGTLVLSRYFHTQNGDTGRFDVRHGGLTLAYNDAEALSGYDVSLQNGSSLQLNASDAAKYTIARLGGSGKLTSSANAPAIAFNNTDTTANHNNTFTGEVGDGTNQLSIRMEAGYQGISASSLSGPVDIALVGGILDLVGSDANRKDGTHLNVHVEADGAMVDGLVLHGNDQLDLGGRVTSFNVTLKGGNIINASSYSGIIFLDDSEGIATCQFELNHIATTARVAARSMHASDVSTSTITTDSLTLTMAGNSLLTLGMYLSEGHAGYETGFFNLSPTRAGIQLDTGASFTISMADVVSDIVACGSEGLSFRISNRNISNLEGKISFGAELALFNIVASFDSTPGSLRFRVLENIDDNVYRATENNESNGNMWDAGNDVYSSADRFVAVYIDRSTDIDLQGATMGGHTDGLVLKNLMGSSSGTLTVAGDGNRNSKVTLRNNLSNEQLADLSEEIGVDVKNMLTYSGDITLIDTDLQVKHSEVDSTTVMHGALTLAGDARMEMTAGVLELTNSSNDLGGVGMHFVENEGQLHLRGGSASLGGHLSLEPVEGNPEANRSEHIKLSSGAKLDLRGDVVVDSGITIGNEVASESGAMNGTVSVFGDAEFGVGAALQNVVLNLAEGSHLHVGSLPVDEEVEPVALKARVVAGDTQDWNLSGLTGSGALSAPGGTQVVNLALEQQSCTFSGAINSVDGEVQMFVKASKYTQTFQGVQGSRGWHLQNEKGGNVVFNLVGPLSDNTLTMGSLILQDGSITSLLMDLNTVDGETGSGLNLASLTVSSGANVTVGHHMGSVRVSGADADGNVYLCLGRVETPANRDLNWTLSGVRNMKDGDYEIWIEQKDDASYVYARIAVDETNKWLEHTSGDNAGAGASMLWGVKDTGSVGGDLAALDEAVSALLSGDNWKTPGNVDKANRILAAAAGASTSVLGMALSGDLDRQLKAIRNRTTSMGFSELQTAQPGDLPHWGAWINAESNFSKQSADGLLPGYKVNGWGGTVGASVDTSENLSFGFALSAMYNDIESDGPDRLKGDMDTYYVSAFARMTSGAWMHTFVGSFGLARFDMNRTVSYGDAGYTTSSDTQGTMFGLMYEVGYGMALDKLGTVCLQPVFNVTWRHTMVDGYSEDGSTAALSVNEQNYDTVTFGMGARLQAIVGQNIFNRTGLLEARALLKLDAGDRRGESDVAFRYAPEGRASVKSVERGAAGLELGLGLVVPLGVSGGNVFFDVSADLRSKATEMNATVGYKFNF